MLTIVRNTTLGFVYELGRYVIKASGPGWYYSTWFTTINRLGKEIHLEEAAGYYLGRRHRRFEIDRLQHRGLLLYKTTFKSPNLACGLKISPKYYYSTSQT